MFIICSIIHAASLDCPNLINFAKGLNLDERQPSIWAQLQIDCCSTDYVTCAGTIVDKVYWGTLGLNGFINGSAIPPDITELSLFSNQLTGGIPPLTSKLQLFDVSSNDLNGTIPSLPSTLKKFYVYENQLVGTLPPLPNGLLELKVQNNHLGKDVPPLPPSLTFIWLGKLGFPGNHFSGSIALNRPLELFINDNYITDVRVTDFSLLTSCDLSNNPLQGNPSINSLPCTKNYLYSPTLLPNTRTSSLPPPSPSPTKTATSNLPTPTLSPNFPNDCFDVINLAYGLNLNTKQPTVMAQVLLNCCVSFITQVTCDTNRVTSINWSNFTLNGFINETALPSELHTLALSSNQITGNVPNVPFKLINVFLDSNQLTGTIPPTFPTTLQQLFLNNNLLTGSIPALPSGTNFRFQMNSLSGSLPTLPNSLIELQVHKNQLTGSVPTLPSTLQHLYLGYPGIAGNRLTGTAAMNSPKYLYINNNLITDIVVQSTSQLIACDVSDNPLAGNLNIPSICATNNLFNLLTSATATSSLTSPMSTAAPNKQSTPPRINCDLVTPLVSFAYFGNSNDFYIHGTHFGNSTCIPQYKLMISNTELVFPSVFTENQISFSVSSQSFSVSSQLQIRNLANNLISTMPIINPFIVVNSFIDQSINNGTQIIQFNLLAPFQHLSDLDTWSIDFSNKLDIYPNTGTKTSSIKLRISLGSALNTNVYYSIFTTTGIEIPGYIRFNNVPLPLLAASTDKNGIISLVDGVYLYSFALSEVLIASSSNSLGNFITNTFVISSGNLVNSANMPLFSNLFNLTTDVAVQMTAQYPEIGKLVIDGVSYANNQPLIATFGGIIPIRLSSTTVVWQYTKSSRKLSPTDFKLSMNLTFSSTGSTVRSTINMNVICTDNTVPNVFGKKVNNEYDFCEICPIGAICSNIGDTYPLGQPGFYPTPSSDGEYRFTQCIPTTACDGSTNCAVGYRGDQCGTCDLQFYRTRTVECTPCSSDSALLVIIFSSVFGVLAIIFLIVKMKFGAFFVVLSIGLRYIQCLFIYKGLLMQWSSLVQQMFDILSIFAFNIDLTSPECFDPNIDYFYKAKVVMVIPVVFLIGLLILSILRSSPFNYPFVAIAKLIFFKNVSFMRPALSKIAKNMWFAVAAFHIFLQVIFITLCSWILGYFACVKFGDKSVFIRSPSLECYTGKHLDNLPLFIGATLLYVIGIPLYFFVLFKFKYSKRPILQYYADMVLFRRDSDYNENGMFIIVISLIARVFMIAAATFLNDVPVLQAMVVMSCCFVYLSYLIHLKPYKEQEHTKIDIYTQIASIVTLNCGILFYVMLTTKYGNQFELGLTIAVLAATISVLTMILYQVSKDYKKAKLKYLDFKSHKKLNEENAKARKITSEKSKSLKKLDSLGKETRNAIETRIIDKLVDIPVIEPVKKVEDSTIRSTVVEAEEARIPSYMYDDESRLSVTQPEKTTLNHEKQAFIKNQRSSVAIAPTIKEIPNLFSDDFDARKAVSK